MDSFEWNKVAGAVLASVLILLGINTLSHSVFKDEPLEQNAYVIEGVEEEATETADAGPVEEGPSLATLLHVATVEDGERIFRRCAACHNVNPGEPNKTGPNLYNTVGHSVAAHEGFSYSDALENFEGDWTFENLSHYLEDPKGFIPGNKMAFAGLKKAEDRAAVILFLNSKMETPVALPEPEAEPEAEDAPGDPVGEGDTIPAPAADTTGDQEFEVDPVD